MFMFTIQRLARVMRREVDRAYREQCGDETISAANGWILSYLYRRRDEEVLQREIEAVFSVRRSTVSNVLQAMEEKQFIRREEVARDARLKRIVLTGRGCALHEAINETVANLEREFLATLTEEEQQQLFSLLKKLNITKGCDVC